LLGFAGQDQCAPRDRSSRMHKAVSQRASHCSLTNIRAPFSSGPRVGRKQQGSSRSCGSQVCGHVTNKNRQACPGVPYFTGLWSTHSQVSQAASCQPGCLASRRELLGSSWLASVVLLSCPAPAHAVRPAGDKPILSPSLTVSKRHVPIGPQPLPHCHALTSNLNSLRPVSYTAVCTVSNGV